MGGNNSKPLDKLLTNVGVKYIAICECYDPAIAQLVLLLTTYRVKKPEKTAICAMTHRPDRIYLQACGDTSFPYQYTVYSSYLTFPMQLTYIAIFVTDIANGFRASWRC